MQVVQQDENRLPLGQLTHDGRDGFERPPALDLRGSGLVPDRSKDLAHVGQQRRQRAGPVPDDLANHVRRPGHERRAERLQGGLQEQ